MKRGVRNRGFRFEIADFRLKNLDIKAEKYYNQGFNGAEKLSWRACHTSMHAVAVMTQILMILGFLLDKKQR